MMKYEGHSARVGMRNWCII